VARRPYLLSAVPAVFGLLVIVLCFISLAVNVSDMPRLDVPGERTVKLDVGKYFVYAEGDDDALAGALQCTVKDTKGTPLEVGRAKLGPSYETLAHSGHSVFDVFIKQPGDHVVACTTSNGGRGTIAIGRNVGITIMIGIVSLILGVVASLILAFVMHRRRL
jgi:hypothetical protein